MIQKMFNTVGPRQKIVMCMEVEPPIHNYAYARTWINTMRFEGNINTKNRSCCWLHDTKIL